MVHESEFAPISDRDFFAFIDRLATASAAPAVAASFPETQSPILVLIFAALFLNLNRYQTCSCLLNHY
jgi:hypothetical protein